jgi:hypothetical protein
MAIHLDQLDKHYVVNVLTEASRYRSDLDLIHSVVNNRHEDGDRNPVVIRNPTPEYFDTAAWRLSIGEYVSLRLDPGFDSNRPLNLGSLNLTKRQFWQSKKYQSV